ncbi:ArsR/SmtB family transcription factor [Salinilacihabitans rarus]|uniref:ArsR/SmtB family transcription factor n=1 Tax=Salinilacihabitans rarus TaxID=2961596 RepID=UPI0020C8695E|nr:helix-turn-helix domain-containing protein [Salinilacihabitans rarus]
MARLFPLRSETPNRERQPRVVDLGDEDADAVFGALSSGTARQIYTTLNDEPGTPSDVADAIDSSIQNVRYHLEKLEEAGLVEVVDTWYSSRGNEMSVYATADGPLIVTSDRSTAEKLKDALSRFIGGVVALAGGSLLVQYGLGRFLSPTMGADDEAAPAGGDDGGGGGGDSGGDWAGTADAEEDAAESTDDVDTYDVTEDSADAGTDVDVSADNFTADGGEPDPIFADDGGVTLDGALETADAVVSMIPPGALFFLIGLVILIALTAYWYGRSY